MHSLSQQQAGPVPIIGEQISGRPASSETRLD
jgi:hypothetical protein